MCKPNLDQGSQQEDLSNTDDTDWSSLHDAVVEASSSKWASEARSQEHYISLPDPMDPTKTLRVASTGLSPAELRHMVEVLQETTRTKIAELDEKIAKLKE